MFMFFGINAILSMWPIGKINLASGEKIIIIKLIYQSFLCVRICYYMWQQCFFVFKLPSAWHVFANVSES